MVFSSILFLSFFLPLFLGVFFLSPQPLKKWIIVFFSLIFYAWGAPVFVFFLLGSCLIDFQLCKYFGKEHSNRKKYLVASLTLNVGLLCYFKYANFFLINLSSAGEQLGFNALSFKEILLPIGISFFTFQKISYALDVYSGNNKKLESFLDYLLYIVMFPQLIAGPIVRFKDIHQQLLGFSNNKFDQKLHGLYRFIIGLSKKVLIANTCALVVAQVNGLGTDAMTSADAWMATFAYCFQIYFDFAGYSDMAIGLGLMMGFQFPENFNFPYLAKSITEFWKRWHMTLGLWMRDYLYIPLGGNRGSSYRTYLNLGLVFLISGLWHGANWNFLIWGAYHGCFLILERLFLSKILNKIPGFLRIFYTFSVVLISWVFFSMDLNAAFIFLEKMMSFSSSQLSINISTKTLTILILGIICSFGAVNKTIEHYANSLPEKLATLSWRGSLAVFPLMLLLLSMAYVWLMNAGFNPFIYYRF